MRAERNARDRKGKAIISRVEKVMRPFFEEEGDVGIETARKVLDMGSGLRFAKP
jgi:hypothetical protein